MHDLGYRLQNGECEKTALIKFLAVLSFLCSSPLNKVNVATQGRKSLQLIRLHNNKEGFFFSSLLAFASLHPTLRALLLIKLNY